MGSKGNDYIRDQAVLAGRITTRMEEIGSSPSQIAKAVGVSITAVGWWLRGQSENIKLPFFFKLCDYLGVEPRWLALRQGEKVAAQASHTTSVAVFRRSVKSRTVEKSKRKRGAA